MNVFRWTASPFRAVGNQFELDHAFGSKIYRHNAVEILRCRGHEHANAFRKRFANFRSMRELLDVR